MNRLLILLFIFLLPLPSLSIVSEAKLKEIVAKEGYTVTILDKEEANAYAIDSVVYFTTGILKSDWFTEDHVPLVLYHELGHIRLEHSNLRLKIAQIIAKLEKSARDKNSLSITKDMFLNISLSFYYMMSRIQELEADSYSINILREKGKGIEICKLFAMDGTENDKFYIATTHPSNTDRILNCERIFKNEKN